MKPGLSVSHKKMLARLVLRASRRMPSPRHGLAALLLVVWAGVAARAAAQGEPPPPGVPIRAMTVEDAIAWARAHQPAVRASLARDATRKAEADVPRAQRLPVAGVTAQLFGATANNTTGTYITPGFIDIPRIGGTRVVAPGTMQPAPSTLVAGGVNQELFDFGRIAAQAAASDALVDVERERARAARLDVTFDVEEAAFAVLAAKAVLKAAGDAYERARVHRDYARAGVESGLRPPIELTRAEADLARFDIGRVRARGGLQASQVTFAAAVGVEDSALDVVGAPSGPPDLPALESAVQHASARDPRILEALAQLRAEEQRTRAIGAEERPDLSLTATISGRAGGAQASGNGTNADFNGWVPYVPNWDVGVVFSWPLFDGTVRAREDASRAREAAAREEIAVVKHEDIARIRVAHAAVAVARAALPGLERAVDAAHANYAQAEARFKAGLGTSVELADAEALRTDAEIQLALGQFELARARAAFGRAIAEGS
jgi:outer membrane protein TolC